MMSRRELREQIFKLLFRIEFNSKEEMQEQIKLFFEEEENQADVSDTAYITEKFRKVYDKLDEFLGQILRKKPLREYGMTLDQADEWGR